MMRKLAIIPAAEHSAGATNKKRALLAKTTRMEGADVRDSYVTTR